MPQIRFDWPTQTLSLRPWRVFQIVIIIIIIIMVRWMRGVSLNDRKRSVDLYSFLGVESVAEVVRRGRLRWFGHVETRCWPVGMWWCRGEMCG